MNARFPGLKEIHVEGHSPGDAWIANMVSLAPLITGLKLRLCREMTDERLGALAPLTRLTYLHLGGCKNVSDAGLKALANLTALAHLNLSLCTQVTIDGLLPLLPNLISLNLFGCTQLKDDGWGLPTEGPELSLRLLAQHCTRLETLKLAGGDFNVSDNGLRALAGISRLDWAGLGQPRDASGELRALVTLTHLDLTDCKEVTDKGLLALAAGGLTNLTVLNLAGCNNYKSSLTDNGVRALAGGLPSLTNLNLQGCKGVCGDGLQALAALTGLASLAMTVHEYTSDDSLRSLTGLTALKRLHWAWCKDVPSEDAFCALAPSSLTSVTFNGEEEGPELDLSGLSARLLNVKMEEDILMHDEWDM
jgi:Leucine-rich repeat (LRR) protein